MQSNVNSNQIIRVNGKPQYFISLIDLVRNVEGTIVELGVGAAKSAKHFCRATKDQGVIRDYWGFDSFQGFPTPSREDLHSTKRDLKQGYFVSHWCRTPGDAIKRITEFCGYPQDNLHFIKGYYSRDLFANTYDRSPIALLHLDCDLYQSYAVALDFFYDFVAREGVLAFDEYRDPLNLKEWPGAAKAIEDWLFTTEYTSSDFYEAIWKMKSGTIVHKFFLQKR